MGLRKYFANYAAHKASFPKYTNSSQFNFKKKKNSTKKGVECQINISPKKTIINGQQAHEKMVNITNS